MLTDKQTFNLKRYYIAPALSTPFTALSPELALYLLLHADALPSIAATHPSLWLNNYHQQGRIYLFYQQWTFDAFVHLWALG